MMIPFELAETEAAYLADILDMWIDGHVPAEEFTVQDRLFDTPEELLDAVDGLNDQKNAAIKLRNRLRGALLYGN